MEDSQIITLYWMRNPDAIVRSGEKYGAYCFSVANNILGSPRDAEECVNDTWMDAWNAIPPHRPEFLRMFFAEITRRVSFDRFRWMRAKKRGGGETPAVLEELSECLADETDVENTVIAKELGQSIRQFVKALPRREGNCFLRRYYFAEPVSEIARSYGMTANHVSVILGRTREKLKRHLVKEGYIDEPKRSV